MKVYIDNLVAGRPMKLYAGKPVPPVSGLSKEQQAAHEALHDDRLLLAVLQPKPGGGYEGTATESGVVTHFVIEGVLEGTVGATGADLTMQPSSLVKGSTIAISNLTFK